MSADVIIVGGGIAGLMTAVRLAGAGRSVSLYERGLLGSQSTTSNHGMIHSGAFYTKWHPEIVPQCQEAVQLFAGHFPEAVIAYGSYGYGRRETIDEMSELWTQQGCPHRFVNPSEVADIFNLEALEGCSFVTGNDLSVSSRDVVVALVRRGIELGVTYHVHASVTGVTTDARRVTGISLAGGQSESAGTVILSPGLGIFAFAQALSLKIKDRLQSRLDMMVAYPGGPLSHTILCHDFGCPNIAPTRGNKILASPYGGVQPLVRDYRRWPVPMGKLIGLASDLRRIFHPGLMEFDAGEAHMCSKTEVVAATIDRFGGQPGYAVIDHAEEDGIENLWTMLPGKMTLAFHASQLLSARVLQRTVPHELPAHIGAAHDAAEALVAIAPWQAIEEASGALPLMPATN